MRAAWSAQPGPQAEAISADWCQELLYGGAAGGGKSDFLLGDYLQDVRTYGAAWHGVLFRKTFDELGELIERSHEIYPATGAKWNEQKHIWRWPNGARLRMRYCEAYRDAVRHQGRQYAWIGWDELGQWDSAASYNYLRARLRSPHAVPTKRIRSTANPGGVGHHWIKAKFITPAPLGFAPLVDPDTGADVMFIPSKLTDNLILLASDPDYANRLRGLGSPELVRAWLEGDWSVIVGSYFPEFSVARHVVAPHALPKEWSRFRAMDWGSARPFSVGWYAVSDGTLPAYPAGALIKYREWYGATSPNVGLRLNASAVGKGIAEREAEDPRMSDAVLDPATFAENGGPSIAERINTELKAPFREADNKRVATDGAISGWDQLRDRLVGDDERPMLYFFSTCRDTIRTLPALQHDDARPEDLDSNGEDHAADETRYACMSRPWMRAPAAPRKPGPRDDYRARANDDTAAWKVA